jgi:hypothetical protein
MGYRDDREALRSEVDTLQKELEVARDDQQRLAGLEQRLDAARREVDAIEGELARAQGRPPAKRRVLMLAVVGVAAGSAAVGGFLFAVPRSPAPIAVVVTDAPTAVTATPGVIAPIAPAAPTAPRPAPPALEKPAAVRRANVVWTATVTKASGLPLALGSSCTVRAGVIPDSTGMHPIDVEVTCGGRTIYDEKGMLNGMAMLDSDAKQRAGAKPGSWVYDIAYRDRGDRASTRNQADLDSTAKIGKVWSDNLPEFRIDLAIRPGSAPVEVAVVDAVAGAAGEKK